jgi:hypothetical protein
MQTHATVTDDMRHTTPTYDEIKTASGGKKAEVFKRQRQRC